MACWKSLTSNVLTNNQIILKSLKRIQMIFFFILILSIWGKTIINVYLCCHALNQSLIIYIYFMTNWKIKALFQFCCTTLHLKINVCAVLVHYLLFGGSESSHICLLLLLNLSEIQKNTENNCWYLLQTSFYWYKITKW